MLVFPFCITKTIRQLYIFILDVNLYEQDKFHAQARIFLLVHLREKNSDLGSWEEKMKKKKSSENDLLTGHFQLLFFFVFFLNISRTNSKTSKVNQHLHAGQCKSTGGCYELVVAIFCTGAGVKGKKHLYLLTL